MTIIKPKRCKSNRGHWCGYKSCACSADSHGCPECCNHGHMRNYYARDSIGFVAGHMPHPAGAL